MNGIRSSLRWLDLAAAAMLALVVAGCGGGGGGSGSVTSGSASPPDSAATSSGALAAASSLNMAITQVTINSPPVVTFNVTDQNGTGMTGLTATDLRFNIAKLVPGVNGAPSTWQNYINRASGGAVQGSQERSATGFPFGTLVNNGDGSYTYTFATDIRDPSKNPCPAPCTDADGNALDLSYQPGFTHRVTIQQANSAYAKAAATYDFIPASGGVATTRDIVANGKCNECHEQLTAHGTRVDVKLCVTCHNPGSWVATSGKPNVTVDFKSMIHKIHDGSSLPSVLAGTPFKVGNTDFSDVTFPQDVRNCTKCHDGTPGAANVTAQGDNWKTKPSRAACGACHDNVYFGTQADLTKPYQTVAHPGGVATDDSTCALCHAAGRYTDNKDIVVAHSLPTRLKAAVAKFKYNIISVSPTTPGSKPVVTFSVTDPTNGDAPYDIKSAAAFTAAGGASALTVKLAWNTADFNNNGSGQSYGQPVSINALSAAAVAAGGGTYTVTSTVAIPATQTGTLRVMMEGHPAGDVTTSGSFTDRLAVKSVFKDVAMTGTASARRVVVDVAKCDVCHDVLSAHGGNRNDEPGVCVMCHNLDASDKGRRTGVGSDGKTEEAIDFKRLIHGIHAGQSSNGGFRSKGLVVYGFGNVANDFSKVVFPGKLSDCTMCHTATSYQLTGTWATPTASGVLGSSIDTGASATDPTDNLRISPTAAVCSSCHDSDSAKTHMQDAFNGGLFSVTQAAIAAGSGENCTFCHGPGRALDVKSVHNVK
jgi:OmcA/MtrC family decaheme c-type cytochrome